MICQASSCSICFQKSGFTSPDPPWIKNDTKLTFCRLKTFFNKVITTMVIRPLDDPTWCAQSVVTDLRPLCLGYVYVGIGMSSFGSPPMGSCAPLTHMVYLSPFLSYLSGFKSVSTRPTQIRWQIPLQKLSLRRAAKNENWILCEPLLGLLIKGLCFVAVGSVARCRSSRSRVERTRKTERYFGQFIAETISHCSGYLLRNSMSF